MFYTIPTLMTLARIVAIPLIVGVYYLPMAQENRNLVATSMFVLFAITDWLDGYLARKLNQTSAFGAFLDPVADKFLVCAALLMLVEMHRVHVLVALVIIGREIAISALREWMAGEGHSSSVGVAMIGKIKTAVQMLAILVLLYWDNIRLPSMGTLPIKTIGHVLIAIAAFLTLLSMAYYLKSALPKLKGAQNGH